MKKILLIIAVFFLILSFVGAGYVIYTKGEANAGYGVVPSVFALVTFLWLIAIRKRENK